MRLSRAAESAVTRLHTIERVIVVRLQGRLGNQMFEYAIGRSLAERLGTELVLDSTAIVQGARRGRRYELDCFDLGAKVCPVGEVARLRNPSRLVRTLQRLRPSRRPYLQQVAEDSSQAFDPAVLASPAYSYLVGYWQFEAYFLEHEALIREAFRFPTLSAEGRRIADEIRATQATSVHVRRGDYLQHEQLGGLDADYYRRGVDAIASQAGDSRVVVFSDDPAWCAENLALPNPLIVDRSQARGDDWEDMHLMSLCRHHVIANSSYSWWGAWLDPSPSKIVVAPKRWVRTGARVGDPVPARWLRL